MKISSKFEIKCDKCGCTEIVAPDREDNSSPRWPDDWLRVAIESSGGGAHALCGACKKSFWVWMKEA